MLRFLLPLIFTLGYANTLFAECTTANEVLGARYKTTTIKAAKESKQSRHIVLWRNGKQIAYEYPDSGFTELWEQTSNGMLRLVRYFAVQARGIEYQPNEIKIAKNKNAWETKYQLIANEQIKAMQLKSTQGKDCHKLETYFVKTGDKTITLQWLPHQRLINSYSEESKTHKLTWDLEQTITVPDKVKSVFITLSNYQTTDYADIGDNESDPFLMKMINLGFIEHGASGFYDAQGNRLQGHQH